jgi:hypothetical protein
MGVSVHIIYGIKAVAIIGCLCNATVVKLQKASVHYSIFSIFFTFNFCFPTSGFVLLQRVH